MSGNFPGEVRAIGHSSGRNTPSRKKRFNSSKSKLPVLLLIILVVYAMFSFGARFKTLYVMQQDVREMQEQVEKLTKKNAELYQELELVKTDAYVEEVARENLGLIREGEVQVVPVNPGSGEAGNN